MMPLKASDEMVLTVSEGADLTPPEIVPGSTNDRLSIENKLKSFYRLKEELKEYLE